MSIPVKTSKPPRHVYYGPRDPVTGDMVEEPVYEHQEYPKVMYHEHDGTLEINSDAELNALGKEWQQVPFGPPTAPSQEQIRAAAQEARKTLHVKK